LNVGYTRYTRGVYPWMNTRPGLDYDSPLTNQPARIKTYFQRQFSWGSLNKN
jgi:hypothetical protein